MIPTCIKLFNLTPTSQDWGVAADWLDDQGETLLAASIRSRTYCCFNPASGDDLADVSDFGSGSPSGYCESSGSGSGRGYGDGTGNGYGDGTGNGYGYGYVFGAGAGYGYGYVFGAGAGY